MTTTQIEQELLLGKRGRLQQQSTNTMQGNANEERLIFRQHADTEDHHTHILAITARRYIRQLAVYIWGMGGLYDWEIFYGPTLHGWWCHCRQSLV